ncbi:MAG TPA: AAA family ATPase [Firmicutes bacterium]|nr:AAA family ATPase [Bacillota bacterium]
MSDRIVRVKSLTLNNFRGFIGEETVNTDADIVFLNGPNGVGKTSFIDALCLALTGHYYKEREPLISYDDKFGRIAAIVSLGSKQEKIEAILKRSRAGCSVEWDDSSWFKGNDSLGPLHARASFYYQDILKYLFEEEDAQVHLEEFLLASEIPLGEVREACKHGLSLIDKFEESFVTRSGFKSKDQIESERHQHAKEFESALDEASEEISKVLADYGFQGPVPKQPLTTQASGMRKQWKENLLKLVRDYSKCPNIAFSHELTSDLPTVLLLEDLYEVFQKLVNHQRDMRLKKSSLQQQISAFFAARNKNEDPVTEIAVTTEKIHEMQLEHQQIKVTIEGLIKQRHRAESSLRHYESAVQDGLSLAHVLKEIRRSGNDWLSEERGGHDPSERAPEEVLSWLQSAVKALDETDPPVDEQMTSWLQKQIDQRTALSEEISKLEASLRFLSQTIQRSKEFFRILDAFPQLNQAISQQRYDMVSIEALAEKLEVHTKVPTTKESVNAFDRLVLCTKAWIDFEKQANEDDRARRSDVEYKAIKGQLEHLKDALIFESGDQKSVTGAVQLIAPQKRKGFAKSIDRILERLHVDSGFIPTKLETRKIRKQATWRYFTGDDRTLSCLSSGQRSLVGIASLISLNAALQSTLWADVLAFDDFTSSLDLNQIPRLASLLRQIAYGSGISEETGPYYRRQVFLVSHHEDLTNKLLDVLIPPPGRTMRVINFTGWSSSGPTFEELDIIGSSASAEDVRDSLPRLLADELRRFFGRPG